MWPFVWSVANEHDISQTILGSQPTNPNFLFALTTNFFASNASLTSFSLSDVAKLFQHFLATRIHKY